MKVTSYGGYLYVNYVRVTLNVCTKKSNIDSYLMSYDELLEAIMDRKAYNSLKQTTYTKKDLLRASLRFDYKHHLVINQDMQELICFNGKDVVESFYICLNEVQKY